MNRTQIINKYIEENNFTSYLEIGVDNGINLHNVKCSNKVGVDPNPSSPCEYHCTSDEFFKINKQKFDIIFIDGLHHSEQVYKDVKNSLKCLNKNGVIVMHDCNPTEEIIQRVPRETQVWTGDCWKAFVRLRNELNKEMFVINTDWGCGVITSNKGKKANIKEELNYNNFVKNRKEWLNLIEVEEFLNTFVVV